MAIAAVLVGCEGVTKRKTPSENLESGLWRRNTLVHSATWRELPQTSTPPSCLGLHDCKFVLFAPEL